VKRIILLTALALLASMVCLGPSQSATQSKTENKEQEASIRVFVFAASNQTEFTDPGEKDRDDSVEDSKKALKKNKLTVVTDRESADITVEVLGRGYQKPGTVTKMARFR
jgi:hypothetical protein